MIYYDALGRKVDRMQHPIVYSFYEFVVMRAVYWIGWKGTRDDIKKLPPEVLEAIDDMGDELLLYLARKEKVVRWAKKGLAMLKEVRGAHD